MALNYAPGLPHDKNGEPQQGLPSPFVAKARYTSENATASSVVSVSHDTTVIEVAALNGDAAIRWVPTTDTAASVVTIAGSTSNFDHVIANDTVRRFVIPIETAITNPQSVQGINRSSGLYQRVALKTMGVASVMLSEF